jgi:hypothetical protein
VIIQLIDDDGVCLDMCDFQEELESAQKEFPMDAKKTHHELAIAAMAEAAEQMIRQFC